MAFRTVIELDYRGLGQLLESKGVLDDLEARASRIQAAADARGVMVEGIPGNVALPVEVAVDWHNPPATQQKKPTATRVSQEGS